MNSRTATLGDFVQQLLLQLGPHRELHFKQERPWHEFFYQLKASPQHPGKPTFFKDLFFDWNGEYPRCQELSAYLHSLHWTGCMTAANPGYDRFKLNEEVGNLWRTNLPQDFQRYIEEAATLARNQLAA